MGKCCRGADEIVLKYFVKLKKENAEAELKAEMQARAYGIRRRLPSQLGKTCRNEGGAARTDRRREAANTVRSEKGEQ